MEENPDILQREGKETSLGILKGLKKQKYPSLEQDHLSRMKVSKRKGGEGS